MSAVKRKIGSLTGALYWTEYTCSIEVALC